MTSHYRIPDCAILVWSEYLRKPKGDCDLTQNHRLFLLRVQPNRNTSESRKAIVTRTFQGALFRLYQKYRNTSESRKAIVTRWHVYIISRANKIGIPQKAERRLWPLSQSFTPCVKKPQHRNTSESRKAIVTNSFYRIVVPLFCSLSEYLRKPKGDCDNRHHLRNVA